MSRELIDSYISQTTPLTRDQVSLLKSSFKLLKVEQLGARFYAYLFDEYPNFKKLYQQNLRETGIKFLGVIELVVFSFEEFQRDSCYLQKSLIFPLNELGRKHLSYGVKHEYYSLGMEIFIKALREELNTSFSEEIEKCWRMAFQHLIFFMKN